MLINIQTSHTRLQTLLNRAKQMLSDDRREVHGMGAQYLTDLVRAHLASCAQTHHGTAQRLGAKPTGHLEKAARRTSPFHDGAGFGALVESPGITRARGELTITPQKKQWLTIPLHALAYGKRVSEVRENMPVFRPNKKGGGKHNILATTQNGELVALYALVKSARIPHEPGLLPTDTEIRKAAGEGMKLGFFAALQRGRA